MSSPRFEAERRAAAEGALLRAMPDLGVFAVTGHDRLRWLNGLVTQDVAKLEPGDGVYGLSVGKNGKIGAELFLLAGDVRVLVVLARDRLALIREHFDKHLVMEDAELSEALPMGALFTHGPRSREIVTAARAAGAEAAMVDWTGRGDAGIVLAPEGEVEATRARALARAGERGALASDEAWEALRIAWGVPRFGVDFDEETLPQEASLEKVAVSFSKGCYLGQETVFRLEKRGHARRRLMRLGIEGDAPVEVGAEISMPGGGAVGSVTSATAAPEGDGWLALGYVKHKQAEPDTALLVAGRTASVLGRATQA